MFLKKLRLFKGSKMAEAKSTRSFSSRMHHRAGVVFDKYEHHFRDQTSGGTLS